MVICIIYYVCVIYITLLIIMFVFMPGPCSLVVQFEIWDNDTPSFLLLLMVVLTILGLLCFHVKFSIIVFNFWETSC